MPNEPTIAAAAVAVVLFAVPASATTVVYHTGNAAYEDGRPGFDLDATSTCGPATTCVGGTRDGMSCSRDSDCPDIPDGQLSWSTDVVHVVSNGFTVIGQYQPITNSYDKLVLTIGQHAIVKFAHTCTLDGSGNITSCTPTTIGTTEIGVAKDSNLRIDRAKLTDIRDDTLGGDTNNDGSATTPVPAYGIIFSGNGNDLLFGSEVRYAREIGKIGSMAIRLNEFVQLGGLSAGYGQGSAIQPPVRGSVPGIEINHFEIVAGSSGPGAIDLRGVSPVVWGNRFTGSGTALRIGPAWEDPYYYRDPMPESGTTRILRNRIETKHGILTDVPSGGTVNALEQVGFRAEIEKNVLDGLGGNEGIGLRLEVNSDSVVRFNSIRDYATPVVLTFSGVPYPPTSSSVARMSLALTDNSFSLDGVKNPIAQNLDVYWSSFGAFVNAEHNWWGHYSGPVDASNADSLANPNGLGLSLTNGIDYKPFLGVDLAADVDSISIEAYSVPDPLDTETTAAQIMADVDYELKSASSGTVKVYVRNSLGEVLNPPGATVQVQSSATSVEVGPILLDSISPYATWLTVEAVLVPNATDADEVHSNLFPLPVFLPARSFKLSCVSDASLLGDCPSLELLPGNPTLVRMRFGYTLGGSDVHAEVEIDVRDKETGEVLQTLPSKPFTAPPGFQMSHIEEVATSFLQQPAGSPERVLVIRYRATDDDGAEIGRGFRTLPILDRANILEVDPVFAHDADQHRRGQPTHMIVGEKPTIDIGVSHRIGTKGIVGWRSRVLHARAVDAQDATLQTFLFSLTIIGENLSTGFYRSALTSDATQTIPAGSKEFVFDVVLEDPNDLDHPIYSEEVRIPVKEVADVVSRTVPAGASVKTFEPIPAKLEVETNTSDGLAVMEQILEPMFDDIPVFELESEQGVSPRAARTAAEPRLIPLNRHFSIYDTLPNAGLSATVTFEYDPEEDFPDDPGFDPDSLVVAVVHPLSGYPEALPSTHDKAQHTVTADYDGFYGLWTVASDATEPAAACADPNADGKTTAADALFALRASVGSTVCVPCICDVNKNGAVTSSDALLILRVAVGQSSNPTCNACTP